MLEPSYISSGMTNEQMREQRIRSRIVVDAYTREEQATGWYAYLHDMLEFPFTARCREELEVSPVKTGETVNVVGMPTTAPSLRQQFVTIAWNNRELDVPLRQLEPIQASDETEQAIADWHYWLERYG